MHVWPNLPHLLIVEYTQVARFLFWGLSLYAVLVGFEVVDAGRNVYRQHQFQVDLGGIAWPAEAGKDEQQHDCFAAQPHGLCSSW